jgi:hypothetical protein
MIKFVENLNANLANIQILTSFYLYLEFDFRLIEF